VIAKRRRRAMKDEGEEGGSVTTDTNVLPRCQCTGDQCRINNAASVSEKWVKCASVCIMTITRW
jgi:hypothetical protein